MESSQFAGISRRPLVISLFDHTQQLMSSCSNKLYDMLIVMAFKYPAKPGISPYIEASIMLSDLKAFLNFTMSFFCFVCFYWSNSKFWETRCIMFHVLEAGPPRPPPPKFPPAAKVTNIYKGCSSNLAFSDSMWVTKLSLHEFQDGGVRAFFQTCQGRWSKLTCAYSNGRKSSIRLLICQVAKRYFGKPLRLVHQPGSRTQRHVFVYFLEKRHFFFPFYHYFLKVLCELLVVFL